MLHFTHLPFCGHRATNRISFEDHYQHLQIRLLVTHAKQAEEIASISERARPAATTPLSPPASNRDRCMLAISWSYVLFEPRAASRLPHYSPAGPFAGKITATRSSGGEVGKEAGGGTNEEITSTQGGHLLYPLRSSKNPQPTSSDAFALLAETNFDACQPACVPASA